MSIIRTRWAAIGAAVAVTLGAGGIGIVSATQPADAVTFVPITPCRVMDTRTEFNVGPKTSPVGPGAVYTVNTTTGNTGKCSDIPTTATGVSLNITALDATLPTFLTIWATGQPQPEASSLNPVPGQPPTPNAVTTGINPGGQFDIYNLQGNVQVIADINGYYTDHHHDDRYYTKDQTDSAITSAVAGKANAANTYTKGQVDSKLNPPAILVTPGDLRASTGWAENGFGVLRSSAGVDTCAYASVSIPAGRTISSFDIRYQASAVDVEVRLRQDEFSEGFENSFDYITTGETTLDGVGGNEFYYALDNLPVTGSASVLPGLQHQVEICSGAQILVNAVRVNFSD